MKRDVTVISLRQFESAGGLSDGYAFEDFSCPLNEEVQDFLRKKAVHSLHLGASMTYLVYDSKTSCLLGYFTLVLKSFSIEKGKLSKTKCRLIERFADVDKDRYTAAVYLIAQIGKNFALDDAVRIEATIMRGLNDARAELAEERKKLDAAKAELEKLRQDKFDTARKMKGKGFAVADIADLTGLTADEIAAL